MNITIATQEDMKTINEFIKGIDCQKSETAETIRDTYITLIAYGMDSQKALNNINHLVTVMKNEYGDRK